MKSALIVNPAAESWPASVETMDRPVASGPAGKQVAILSNGWSSMGILAARMGDVLTTQYEAKGVLQESIPIGGPAPSEQIDRVASQADLAIVGLAN